MPGLMDQLGAALTYISDDAKKQRAEDREMANYEKKLKLANEVQMQLEERKIKLSQQYPEISKTVNTPMGVTLGIYPDGTTKELYKDEEFRNAVILNKQAPAIRAEAEASLAPSRIGLNNANAEAAAKNAEANKTRADKAGAPKAPKPPKAPKAPSASELRKQAEAAEEELAMEMFPSVMGSEISLAKWRRANSNIEERKKLIQERMRAKDMSVVSTSEMAAPTTNDPFSEF